MGRVRLVGWLVLCVGCAGLVAYIVAGSTLAVQLDRASIVGTVVSVVAVPFSTRAGRNAVAAATRWVAAVIRRPRGGPGPVGPSRHDALVLAASAVVAPASLYATGRKLAGATRTSLRGAVWPRLFLTDEHQVRPQWQGLADSLTVADLSGMQLLGQTPPQIAGLDFAVCPNDYIKREFLKACESAGRPARDTPHIVTEDMVVLGRRDWLEALCVAGYVIRTKAGPVVFDLARYVHRFTQQTWATVDPRLARKNPRITPGDPIRVHSPDPATSSSGQNFLISLVWALDNDPSNAPSRSGSGQQWPDARRLWEARGPLGGHLYDHATEVWNALPDLGLIYTYEHLARTTIEGPDGANYFVARVNPKCEADQTLVCLRPSADVLADRLTDPTTLPGLARDLHLRCGEAKITPYLSEGDLADVERILRANGQPLETPPPDRQWDQKSLPDYQTARMDPVYKQYLAERRPALLPAT